MWVWTPWWRRLETRQLQRSLKGSQSSSITSCVSRLLQRACGDGVYSVFFPHHFQFWLFIRQRPSGVPPKSHDAWQTSSREAPRIAAESGGPRETLVLICAALLSSPRWRRRSITATICRSTRLSAHGGTKQPDQRSTAGEDAPPPLWGVDAPPPRTPDRCFGRRR